MALVKLSDGKTLSTSVEMAGGVWQVLGGKLEPDEDQAKFCQKVDQVIFNWRTAPDDWLKQNAELLKPIVLGRFMCDRSGQATRPNPLDKTTQRVAQVIGLTFWKIARHEQSSMV